MGVKSVQTRPKCWCIGLGRTGTKTICNALRLLGYRATHNPPFEKLKNLEGGADNGVTIFYKYLDYKFPGSKFVLTMREKQSWLESIEHIANARPLTHCGNDLAIMRRMTLYETVGFDRDLFSAAYDRHHAEVKRYFRERPADLLEMNIIEGDGWETLCPFLGLQVPVCLFPHLHQRGKENMPPGASPKKRANLIPGVAWGRTQS